MAQYDRPNTLGTHLLAQQGQGEDGDPLDAWVKLFLKKIQKHISQFVKEKSKFTYYSKDSD